MNVRPFKLKTPRVAEHELQKTIARTLRIGLDANVWWCAIDHASASSVAVAALRKARGVVAGIPDFLFIHHGRALFIELKALDTKVSPAQIETHVRIREAGSDVAICRSVDEVIAVLRQWEIPLRVVA